MHRSAPYMASVDAFRNEEIPDTAVFGNKSQSLRPVRFPGRITCFEDFNKITWWTDFSVNIKLLQEKWMPGIFGRKCEIQRITTVASYNWWILAISEITYMYVPWYWFIIDKLAGNGRNKAKDGNNEDIILKFSGTHDAIWINFSLITICDMTLRIFSHQW